MAKLILTGAAGFVGSHVLSKLYNHDVVSIDSYEPQVHGTENRERRAGEWPILFQADTVIHLAALVGVGQSMYEPTRYIECNTLDTARFLENLTKNKPKRLVVASSMSIYGEGAEELIEFRTPGPNKYSPKATPETKPPDIRNPYALTKFDQEQLCLIWGKVNGVEVIALRFFNTWGPNQSLNNPYTGVLTIFANRLLNGKPPIIFEDGQQTRDFVHVDDVSNAVVHMATKENVESGIYNVGTGVPRTIDSVARSLASVMETHIMPEITGKKRSGDIRHCYADISKIESTGWFPKMDWERGLISYVQWIKTQPRPEDGTEKAIQELEQRNLLK